jgi:transposase
MKMSNWNEEGYEVTAAVESTGNTRYFCNQLLKAGIEVRIVNTLKFKVVNESVKKTDKHDSRTLGNL